MSHKIIDFGGRPTEPGLSVDWPVFRYSVVIPKRIEIDADPFEAAVLELIDHGFGDASRIGEVLELDSRFIEQILLTAGANSWLDTQGKLTDKGREVAEIGCVQVREWIAAEILVNALGSAVAERIFIPGQLDGFMKAGEAKAVPFPEGSAPVPEPSEILNMLLRVYGDRDRPRSEENEGVLFDRSHDEILFDPELIQSVEVLGAPKKAYLKIPVQEAADFTLIAIDPLKPGAIGEEDYCSWASSWLEDGLSRNDAVSNFFAGREGAVRLSAEVAAKEKDLRMRAEEELRARGGDRIPGLLDFWTESFVAHQKSDHLHWALHLNQVAETLLDAFVRKTCRVESAINGIPWMDRGDNPRPDKIKVKEILRFHNFQTTGSSRIACQKGKIQHVIRNEGETFMLIGSLLLLIGSLNDLNHPLHVIKGDFPDFFTRFLELSGNRRAHGSSGGLRAVSVEPLIKAEEVCDALLKRISGGKRAYG
ncbi:MAG: hypothetical protein COR54_01475 [Elusimicrobia bacterium CG22_combo_CG10-13_8_21_14_all_63_91]|nr:MAG: hypothetical protein COR54_01475 [Elusimicrobia bacterium CG22_combo_CG10-13_8_21_14_all_63_91]